jgi:UDP-N-acetylglucosamine--N-acetylmuramyl-(pentapeptide) pyrophosphoryl-undecaprenol N-acetylglucosamine transferase
MIKIAFSGGGTGGHIYPALAIADALREAGGVDMFWIGSKKGMDRRIVEEAGIRFYGICAGKLRRYFSLRNIIDFFKVLWGLREARRILSRENPDLLFSKGGFVSVPPVLAAANLGIPVHTHESDISPGLATRINARFAERIWTAYKESADAFLPSMRLRLRCSGNPVRRAFRHASSARGRAFLEERSGQKITAGQKILLVLGGSQGAKEINELVEAGRAELSRWFFVVHQTGGSALEAGPNYLPLPYLKEEMPDVLAAAALVLGRSGAGTVWEAATAGIPMALIPLAGSGTRGDQVENAAYFEKHGAALTLVHPTRDALLEAVGALAEDGARRKAMAAAARTLGAQDAAREISAALLARCRAQRSRA